MNIIKRLLGGKKSQEGRSKHDDLTHMTIVTTGSSYSKSSNHGGKKKKKKSKESSQGPSGSSHHKHKPAVPNEEVITPNEQALHDWVKAMNRQASVEEMLSFFSNEDVNFHFEDDIVLPAKVMVPGMHELYASFPNLNFHNSQIKEIRPGVVVIEEQVVQGTHTGAPYKFANYRPVPRSNKHVVLDAERVFCEMDENGKIAKYEMIALGSMVGVHGLYLGVGGKMGCEQWTS